MVESITDLRAVDADFLLGIAPNKVPVDLESDFDRQFKEGRLPLGWIVVHEEWERETSRLSKRLVVLCGLSVRLQWVAEEGKDSGFSNIERLMKLSECF